MLRVGVIGVGHLGRHHARVAAELPECSLVGVHDVDRERGAAVAAERGVRAFDDLDGLLAEVNAAAVAVPTSAHHAVAMRCLDSGVHVLI